LKESRTLFAGDAWPPGRISTGWAGLNLNKGNATAANSTISMPT
jgi:hypothetical protein